MDLQQISALSALIQSSVAQLVDVAHHDDVNVHTPALHIVAAAAQLIALVRPPEQSVMDAATAFHLSSSLRLVVESHVVEIIRERGTGPHAALHVTQIAAVNGVDHHKLARILRLLATHHIFSEVAPDTFANNALSATLDTHKPLADILARPHDKYDGTSGLAALIGLTTDESMRASLAMPDTLLNPATTHSTHALDAPFSRAWDTPLHMYAWLAQPAHARTRLARFHNAMRGISRLTPDDAILRGFAWTALPSPSTIIDVGGGVGAASLPIVRSCPNVRLVIQDSEEVLRRGTKFWETHYPEALESGRVTFQAHDFFEPQPPLAPPASSKSDSDSPAAGAAANPQTYLLRMIMHNWADDESARILRHLRAAAGARVDVRLVIVDAILMFACRASDGGGEADGDCSSKANGECEGKGEADAEDDGGKDKEGQAPLPLLPNWGAANALAYKLDLQMLCNHNAGERTLAEFTELLARTGWRVAEVHQFHESWMPQIVAVPAPVHGDESEAGGGGCDRGDGDARTEERSGVYAVATGETTQCAE